MTTRLDARQWLISAAMALSIILVAGNRIAAVADRAEVLPIGQSGDLATANLPGHGVEVVEGDLLPVDIQPAYDGHRDLRKLRKGRTRP